jgi:hypothetical protein
MDLFDPLIGGETPAALLALATAADNHAILTLAGIDDLLVEAATVGTLHKGSLGESYARWGEERASCSRYKGKEAQSSFT